MVETSEVVRKFMERGMHITPKALEIMRDASGSSISSVLSDLEEREDRPSIVTDEVINQILSSEETIPSSTPKPPPEEEGETFEKKTGGVGPTSPTSEPSAESVEERSSREGLEVEFEGREERPGEVEGRIKIIRDITGKSTSEGNVEDFVKLFRDRFEKLSSIIRSREGFQNYTEMDNVFKHEGDVVNLVGLVNEKRETRKQDAWIVELEDLTGRAVVYAKDTERNERIIESIKKIVTDEVIGVRAKVPNNLRRGKRSPLVWGNEIFWPEIPLSKTSSPNQNQSGEAEGYAVLISDLHVGSSKFLPEIFEKFLEWLHGAAGNREQRKLAKRVKYLIIAGDLVDGIGIYPGQQEELEIENVRDQYTKVAELLSRVPDEISIIVSPGNHDAVRLAEPQPAMYSEVAAPLRDMGVQLVGNPAFFSIEGVKFLVYHGAGFDDLISANLDLDRDDAVLPMEEALKRRHLAPIYGKPMGGRTPVAPEEEDYLIIEDVPDVFHCGHLHRYGCKKYRNVLMVNSATFQEQTVFMKRQGITPTPGHVPIVNLQTKEAEAINFA